MELTGWPLPYGLSLTAAVEPVATSTPPVPRLLAKIGSETAPKSLVVPELPARHVSTMQVVLRRDWRWRRGRRRRGWRRRRRHDRLPRVLCHLDVNQVGEAVRLRATKHLVPRSQESRGARPRRRGLQIASAEGGCWRAHVRHGGFVLLLMDVSTLASRRRKEMQESQILFRTSETSPGRNHRSPQVRSAVQVRCYPARSLAVPASMGTRTLAKLGAAPTMEDEFRTCGTCRAAVCCHAKFILHNRHSTYRLGNLVPF